MTAVEAGRRASRPVKRHQPRLRTVCQFCMRCDRLFRAETSSRERFLCHQASERLYGTDHPPMEISGW